MTGAKHHVSIPADDAGLLEAVATTLETYPTPPDSRYAARLREVAAQRKGNPDALTAESPIEALVDWGIEIVAVNLLKREGGINTIADLCNRDADQLLDIRNIGDKRLRAIVAVLAQPPHYMGLRPRPRYTDTD